MLMIAFVHYFVLSLIIINTVVQINHCRIVAENAMNMCHQMASLAFIFYKIQFWMGHHPVPYWGGYDALQIPLSTGEGTLPFLHPLDHFSVADQCLWHQHWPSHFSDASAACA